MRHGLLGVDSASRSWLRLVRLNACLVIISIVCYESAVRFLYFDVVDDDVFEDGFILGQTRLVTILKPLRIIC